MRRSPRPTSRTCFPKCGSRRSCSTAVTSTSRSPARAIAAAIPGARLVELEGVDHLPAIGDSDAIVEEVEEFLTGQGT